MPFYLARTGVEEVAEGAALVFSAFCFSSNFFLPLRCLCHATRLVLFTYVTFPMYVRASFILPCYLYFTLFFGFVCTLKIDFGQIVTLVSAIKVLIIVAQFVVVLVTIITEDTVLNIGTDSIAAPL